MKKKSKFSVAFIVQSLRVWYIIWVNETETYHVL